MNWDQIKGDWKQLKGTVRERWGELTNDDVDRVAGEREQLIGRLQKRYGIARDKAEQQVDDFVASLERKLTGAKSG